MKRIIAVGVKRPGKPWVIRFADRDDKVVGKILPAKKEIKK